MKTREGSAPLQELTDPHSPRAAQSLPAAKAMIEEARGQEPRTDSEGMQDMIRKVTDTRPHTAARMRRLCVAWM